MRSALLHAQLDEVAAYLDRFVHFQSEHQLFAVALWAVNTYTFEQCDLVPYLAVSSPEKRSGKSLLLDVLKMVLYVGAFRFLGTLLRLFSAVYPRQTRSVQK